MSAGEDGGDAAADRDPGLHRARAVLAARPFGAMPGTRRTAMSAEGVELLLPVSGAPEQQHGVLHGGVVAYLADNALASAGGLRLSGRIATAEMTINHVRPAAGDALVARGRALSSGRTQAVARCEVFAVSGGV
ncbi:MAG: PaaI family thioesterase [Acetobacteraceae bacterium]|nr:PaaI family thioesterase [Acetobacteraceae bacterium]